MKLCIWRKERSTGLPFMLLWEPRPQVCPNAKVRTYARKTVILCRSDGGFVKHLQYSAFGRRCCYIGNKDRIPRMLGPTLASKNYSLGGQCLYTLKQVTTNPGPRSPCFDHSGLLERWVSTLAQSVRYVYAGPCHGGSYL